MSNFFTAVLNSDIFYILLGLWIFASIANRFERIKLGQRLEQVITKPTIFQHDESDTIPFYPRKFLEGLVMGVRDMFSNTRNITYFISNSISQQFKFIVKDDTKSNKILGYLVSFVLFILFLWADAVVVGNTLKVIGIQVELAFLQSYEVAITFGSLFSVIVGALVVSQIYSDESTLSDWNQQSKVWRDIAKILSIFLVVSGLLVIVMLGMARYREVVELTDSSSNFLKGLSDIALIVIVPLNTVIATVLLHFEALKGILVILLIVESLIFILLRIFESFIYFISSSLLTSIDLGIRLFLILFYIVGFILITPIDSLTSMFSLTKK